MAMTTCKECSNAVSDAALTCPKCGIAAPALTQGEKAEIITQSKFAASRAFAAWPFFAGIVMLAISALSGPNAFVSALGVAKWLIGGGALWYIAAEIDRNLHERKKASPAK